MTEGGKFSGTHAGCQTCGSQMSSGFGVCVHKWHQALFCDWEVSYGGLTFALSFSD